MYIPGPRRGVAGAEEPRRRERRLLSDGHYTILYRYYLYYIVLNL